MSNMKEEMRVYEEVKRYLDESLEKEKSSKEYLLLLRMRQMYVELYQLKLAYKKVIQKDFKQKLIKGIQDTRTTLYIFKDKRIKKDDILQGIQTAIDDLTDLICIEDEVN